VACHFDDFDYLFDGTRRFGEGIDERKLVVDEVPGQRKMGGKFRRADWVLARLL
jgi:hypothetical protein